MMGTLRHLEFSETCEIYLLAIIVPDPDTGILKFPYLTLFGYVDSVSIQNWYNCFYLFYKFPPVFVIGDNCRSQNFSSLNFPDYFFYIDFLKEHRGFKNNISFWSVDPIIGKVYTVLMYNIMSKHVHCVSVVLEDTVNLIRDLTLSFTLINPVILKYFRNLVSILQRYSTPRYAT
jgi:hypothetical protein